MNIHEAIIQCLISAKANRAEHTAMAYANGLIKLEQYLQTKLSPYPAPLEQLSIEHLVLFCDWIAAQGLSKSTIKTYICGIRYFVRWLVLHDHLEPTYVESLKFTEATRMAGNRRENKLPRFPAKDAVSKMIEAVNIMAVESPLKERDIALVLFLVSTGCRNAEVVRLNIKDLDMQERMTIVLGKGSKERRVFFSQAAADALKHYWSIRGFADKEYPIFIRHDKGAGGKKAKRITTATVRNIIRQVAAIAGIEQFTPHYFRHAFAIKMLAETHDLALVQDLLGHTNPAATRVYAKIYPEDLRQAHREVFN